MIFRGFLTILSVIAYWFASMLWGVQSTLVAGQVAGDQFLNSDKAYMNFIATTTTIRGITWILPLVFAAVLCLIWFKPIKKYLAALLTMTAVLFVFVFVSSPSQAYFDKTDITEAYTILPNESAFWIPDVGANKDSQAQFDSEDYLKANKLAVKRFVIPHAKLQGSSYYGWDFYVPTGRLIIVDRTTYSHEWVDAVDRGTSRLKEGFPCQSKEGINITAGVSIASSVHEEDAPKFLYNFGVTSTKGDRSQGAVIFASVYYGRPLYEVMGDVGRKKVQTLVCDEIGRRTFDQANSEMIPIMENVGKKATDYFKAKGITLDFIGWADTFSFDPEIQHAVNSSYIAKIDFANATLLQPQVSTIQGVAIANSFKLHGLPAAPTTVVGPMPDFQAMIGTYLATVPKALTPAK